MKKRPSIALLFLLTVGAAGAGGSDEDGLQYVQRLHMPSRADDIGYPRSVTADLHAGEIFVCDVRKNRIVIFDRDGLFLYMIPGGEIFRTPLDIALDPDGYILLLARYELELRLLRLDFDGKFIEQIILSGLPRGVAEPDLVSIAMSPAGDRYYLLDEANLHVWITNRDGEVVGMISLVADLTEKEAVEQVLGHVDVYGDTVMVAAATQGTVFMYDLDGKPKGWVGIRGTAPCQTMFPMAAGLTEAGHAVIVDFQRMLITVWDTRDNRCLGEYSGIGNRPGYVYQPEDLALDSAGRVYVSQGFEGRVQVWAGSGPAAGSTPQAR
jgi:DNA-binding beta-propeller fold protein YncE